MGNEASASEPDRRPEPVTLNIYDLHGHGGGIFKGVNVLLRAAGTGAFHVGVEVFGREWSFGHRESRRSGVYKHAPRENEVHSYRESILMGETDLTQHEVEVLVQRMSPRWRGDGYSVLSRNCCHFCDELCMELGVARPSFVALGPLPDWLGGLARAGAALGGGDPAHEAAGARGPPAVGGRGRAAAERTAPGARPGRPAAEHEDQARTTRPALAADAAREPSSAAQGPSAPRATGPSGTSSRPRRPSLDLLDPHVFKAHLSGRPRRPNQDVHVARQGSSVQLDLLDPHVFKAHLSLLGA